MDCQFKITKGIRLSSRNKRLIMKPLTESQMEKIWKDNSVDTLNPIHKKQFMNYLFGEEFMESENKGALQIYKEN